MRIHATLVVAFTVGTALSSVAAAAELAACKASYEKAQEENTAGHLNAALAHLRSCIEMSCPKFFRDDCERWTDQIESILPTVVFVVRRDGGDVTDVEVSLDGKLLVSSLDGKLVPVDPGPHEFSFTLPGFPSIKRQMLIREGERNRMIDVDFKSSLVATHLPARTSKTDLDLQAKPTSERRTAIFYLPYGLAGLGALGVAGFAVLDIQGNSRKSDLEHSCSPYCQSSQVDEVKTKYLLADTCLAVGLVSLGVATYLFLTSHGEDAGRQAPPTSIGFAPRPSGGGGVVQVATPF
jgi:hypothetical protein